MPPATTDKVPGIVAWSARAGVLRARPKGPPGRRSGFSREIHPDPVGRPPLATQTAISVDAHLGCRPLCLARRPQCSDPPATAANRQKKPMTSSDQATLPRADRADISDLYGHERLARDFDSEVVT